MYKPFTLLGKGALIALSGALALTVTTPLYANTDDVVLTQADLNDDGRVDRGDVTVLSNRLRTPAARARRFSIAVGEAGYDPSFDLNEDGVINLADARLLSLVGFRPDAATVNTTTSELGTLFGGFVRDSQGRFLENVRVRVSTANGQVFNAVTDDRGFYEMNIPAGATGDATVTLNGRRAVDPTPNLLSGQHATYRDLPFFINGGVSNIMNPIALPEIDATGAVTVFQGRPRDQDISIVNGDLELHIPAACQLTLPSFENTLSITRVDQPNTPVAMRNGLYSNNLISLQPEGTQVQCPEGNAITLRFPNRDEFSLSEPGIEFEMLRQGAYQTMAECVVQDSNENGLDNDPADRIECRVSTDNQAFEFALSQVRSSVPQPTITVSGQVGINDTIDTAGLGGVQVASLSLTGLNLSSSLATASTPTGPVIGPGNFLIFNDGRRVRTLNDGSFTMTNVPARLTTNGNAPGAVATNLLEIIGDPLQAPRGQQAFQAPRFPSFNELAFARRVFTLPAIEPGVGNLSPIDIGVVIGQRVPAVDQRDPNRVRPPLGTASGRVLRLDRIRPFQYSSVGGQLLNVTELETGRTFTAPTDVDGNYSFSVRGSYQINTNAVSAGPNNTVSLVGRVSGRIRFPGDISINTITYTSQAESLSVQLSDEQGNPLPDFTLDLGIGLDPSASAVVYGGIFRISRATSSVTTDANGLGVVSSISGNLILPPGDCTVSITNNNSRGFVYGQITPAQGCRIDRGGQLVSLSLSIDPTSILGDLINVQLTPGQVDHDENPLTPELDSIDVEFTYNREVQADGLVSQNYELYVDLDQDPGTGRLDFNGGFFTPGSTFNLDNTPARGLGADIYIQCSAGVVDGCSLMEIDDSGSFSSSGRFLQGSTVRFAVDPITGEIDRRRVQISLLRDAFSSVAGDGKVVNLVSGVGLIYESPRGTLSFLETTYFVDLIPNEGFIMVPLDDTSDSADPTQDVDFQLDPNAT